MYTHTYIYIHTTLSNVQAQRLRVPSTFGSEILGPGEQPLRRSCHGFATSPGCSVVVLVLLVFQCWATIHPQAGRGMSLGVVCALAISGSCSHGKERKEESPGSGGQNSRILDL